MILSFHPIYEGDRNLLVAGREPGAEEARAIRTATAVILPQGCSRKLYRMVKERQRPAFPNYDARFQYSGKTGQIELFNALGTLHPQTEIFSDVDDFYRRHGTAAERWAFGFPLVLKYDWGGEGDSVHLLASVGALQRHLHRANSFGGSGSSRFMIQPYLPHRRRVLRVAVIGAGMHVYWRVQRPGGPFGVNITGGAHIDYDVDRQTKQKACEDVGIFCRRTGINLAGFDLLFPETAPQNRGYFLEINYFFGRRGLGGSERYYRLLTEAIDVWLASLGLSVGTGGPK